jgi:hypothetical protein
MSDALDRVHRSIDEQHRSESALTRRRMMAGTAATLGSLGLLATPFADAAPKARAATSNHPQTILNVAATAEVLATIVNTVGAARVDLDRVTMRNVRAAAREELLHYNYLVRNGGVPLTTRIWVPDAVFASPAGLLSTLEVGDQIFVNAYLIATSTFGAAGNGDLAAVTAEIMGVEAVHRALARQSLGKLGNDRAFMKAQSVETAPGAPNRGQAGFTDILEAAAQLQAAGFGFGARGAGPGAFYEFNTIKGRVPTDPDVNTPSPVAP